MTILLDTVLDRSIATFTGTVITNRSSFYKSPNVLVIAINLFGINEEGCFLDKALGGVIVNSGRCEKVPS